MKINLIFFLSEFNLGGAGNSVFKLCKNLSKNQFIISVICLNKCFYKEELNKNGIQVFEVKSRKTIFGVFELRTHLRFFCARKHFCRKDIRFESKSWSRTPGGGGSPFCCWKLGYSRPKHQFLEVGPSLG